MARLSVILITRDEAANLRDCLNSVRWADEIVVVDSGSTDATLEIARSYTDCVYVHDWPGFGPQKNRALTYATGDWVLSLDADERVTPELRASIEAVLAADTATPTPTPTPTPAGYEVLRLSRFCGREMRHSGWYPDPVLRLFRRGHGRFTDVAVHEAVHVEGAVGRLPGHLQHLAYVDLEQALKKLNRYSTAAAGVQQARGRRGGVLTAVWHGAWSFFRTYVLRAGFLDGREGFMLAVLNAEHSYYRYLKLMLMQRDGRA